MSETAPNPWIARSAWTTYVKAGRHGRRSGDPGVEIETLEWALAGVSTGASAAAALKVRVKERFGADLPVAGQAAFGTTGSLIGSAPGQWLVTGAARGALDDLPSLLAGAAAVTDQTDSRALVRFAGPDARKALAKGFAIDLHPSVFVSGSAAVTRAANLSVHIWRQGETFVIAVPRSSAGSFWSWLITASAEFGCNVAA